MITVANAAKYSTAQGEMAYSITYSEGTKVRAVESKDNIIRQEVLTKGEWILAGKPYVVDHSKKRQAERIKASVLKFLAN